MMSKSLPSLLHEFQLSPLSFHVQEHSVTHSQYLLLNDNSIILLTKLLPA